MNLNTPFVEYLIIGTHTSTWLTLTIMAILRIPIAKITNIDVGLVVLLLPFIYLLGTLFATLIVFLLEPFRKKIQNSVFPYDKYKDEVIAYHSSELYKAYTVRVHRVRVMESSIFNWFLLGMSVLLHVGFKNPNYYIPAITIPLIFSILSIISWRGLQKRAYKFRKNAIEVINENIKEKVQ